MSRTHKPYKIFDHIMLELEINYSDIADVIGVCEASVRNKIKGRSDFTLGEAEAICRAYSLPVSIFFDSSVS